MAPDRSAIFSPFTVRFGGRRLKGDTLGSGCRTLVIHGAGGSSRNRFDSMREGLMERGMASAAFDSVGHGETGGALKGTTLHNRTDQAASVIREICRYPLTLIGASMGAYTALRLTREFEVDTLVLLVPAVYTPAAYDIPFGPKFSEVIRRFESWQDSDGFDILAGFSGHLFIVAAQDDTVIPDRVVCRLYEAAAHARTKELLIIPGSGHRNLFPTRLDLDRTLDRIAALSRREEEI